MNPRIVIDELSRRDPSPETVRPEELSPHELNLLHTIIGSPRNTPSQIVGRRSRLAPTRTRVALATTGAVVITACSLVLGGAFNGTTPRTPHSSDAVVALLTDAATAAASQASVPRLRTGQYYYERNLVSSINLCQVHTTSGGGQVLLGGAEPGDGPMFNYVQDATREEWSTAVNEGAVEDTLTGVGHLFDAAEQAAWLRDGSPSIEHCADPLSGGLQDIAAPTTGSGGVGDLPTDPTTLGSLIAAGRVNDVGQVSAGDGHCPSKAGDAPQIYPQGAVCSVSAQFDIANNLLVAPEGPQVVGPALYQILAKLPGVEELGTRTDALGRSGTAIEDPSTGTVFLIDTTTGALLEQQDIEVSLPAANSDVPVGTVRYSVSFGALSVVNGLGVRPPR
jgi:hypothetical protein